MSRVFQRWVVPALALALAAPHASGLAAQTTIDLRSDGGEVTASLPSGTREVELSEQTQGNCRFGRTWGYDLSKRELWASGGCGGRFRVVSDGAASEGSPSGSNAGAAVAAAAAVAGIALLASRHKHHDDRNYDDDIGRRGYEPPNSRYGDDGREGTLHGAGGLCLDMRGREVRQGTDAIVYNCNGGRNQRFNWTRDGELRVAGMCLDVANNDTRNGAKLVAWPCNGGRNQRWIVSGSTIRSALSGRCLDIRDGNSFPGQNVIVWDCHGSSNQRWWW